MKSLIILMLLWTKIICFHKIPKPDGLPIRTGEFPFHVQLLDASKFGRYAVPICGGSLISSEHILTTAYCLQELNLEETTVYAGTAEILGGDAVLNTIVSFKLHPDYIPPPHRSKLWEVRNNVGVARLKHRYDGVDFISPIEVLSDKPRCMTGITVGLGNMYCYHKPFVPCHQVKSKKIKTKSHDEVKGFNLKNFDRKNVFFYEESPPEWDFRWGHRDYGAPFVCHFDNHSPTFQYGLLSNIRSTFKNHTVRNYTVSVYESLDDHTWFLAEFLPYLKTIPQYKMSFEMARSRHNKFGKSKSNSNMVGKFCNCYCFLYCLIYTVYFLDDFTFGLKNSKLKIKFNLQ